MTFEPQQLDLHLVGFNTKAGQPDVFHFQIHLVWRDQ